MRVALLLSILCALAGCQNTGQMSQWLSFGQTAATSAGYGAQANAVGAVKDTLSSSAGVATALMGKPGSYNIPLPQQIQTLDSTLTKLGYGGTLDKMKDKMDAAAGQAAAQAAPVFQDAIKSMTLPDAIALIGGGETSVTDYFRSHTQTQLAAKMSPIVQQKLQATGFNSEYQTFLGIYNNLPLANKPNLDIQSYVVGKTLDGIYARMAQQEVSIRQDPKKAGSALVKQFFSEPAQK